MNVLPRLTMALLWSGAPIQAQAEQRPILVKRMCGKLIRCRQVPIKGTTNTFDVKTKALPRVDLNFIGAMETLNAARAFLLWPKPKPDAGEALNSRML